MFKSMDEIQCGCPVNMLQWLSIPVNKLLFVTTYNTIFDYHAVIQLLCSNLFSNLVHVGKIKKYYSEKWKERNIYNNKILENLTIF